MKLKLPRKTNKLIRYTPGCTPGQAVGRGQLRRRRRLINWLLRQANLADFAACVYFVGIYWRTHGR